jgi:hypothetical protein
MLALIAMASVCGEIMCRGNVLFLPGVTKNTGVTKKKRGQVVADLP